MQKQLIKINDRIVDLNAVTHATYNPSALSLDASVLQPELVLSFGCDEVQIFTNHEADLVWKILSDRAADLTA